MIRLILVLICFASASMAVEPDEILADPVLESRARDISENLRCVVCQNETIDTSNAGVARDLRLLVRERLVAGASDDEVYDYVVARYGDYVLFYPPWKSTTYALWLAPFFGALFGIIIVGRTFRRSALQSAPEADGLTPYEEEQLAAGKARHSGQGDL
jgi:cytochrome c-type biogenesis protein CcmH